MWPDTFQGIQKRFENDESKSTKKAHGTGQKVQWEDTDATVGSKYLHSPIETVV